MSRRQIAPAFAIVAALLLVGCGGDDGDDSSTSTTTTTVVVPGTHLMSALVGPRDQHLRQIEAAFPTTTITVRGNEITARGERAEDAGRLFEELVDLH